MANFDLSVLLPVYQNDKAPEFELAIGSVVRQTEKASQIVVVQDGPISPPLKDAVNHAAKLAQKHGIEFQCVVNETNLGLGLALNRGLEVATGQFVARMDADDVSKPNRFACQLDAMKNGVDLCYCSSEEFEFDHNNVRCLNVAPSAEQLPRILNFRNPVVHPSIMFRRETALEIGGYRDMLFFEDYDFILRMIKAGACLHGLAQPLVCFRSLATQRARRGGTAYFCKGTSSRIRWVREGLIHPIWGLLSILPFGAYTLSPVALRSVAHSLLRGAPQT